MAGENTAGSIESISLKNFLCHRRLTLSLDPHVNFIVGSNGSGKSAILTAITVCLGSRATFTQRGNSTKSLIREGEQTAQITLVIRNSGDGSYRPDLYPDSITIERTLSHSLSLNGYKIKNSAGRTISTKREDVTLISEHFNFQIDNPLVVLSQETSKRFLSNSTPLEKYEFFLKGTQLEQLSIDYRYTREKLLAIQQALQQTQQSLPSLQREVEVLRQKIEAIQNMQNLYEHKEHLNGELAWSLVREAQLVAQEKQNGLMEVQKKRSLMQEKVESQLEECAKLVVSIEEANDLIQHGLLQQRTFKTERAQYEQQITHIKSSILQIESTKERIQQSIQSCEQELARYSQVETTTDHSSTDQGITRIQSQIETMERQLTDVTGQLSLDREGFDSELTNQRLIEELLGNAKSSFLSLTVEVKNLKTRVATVESSKNDSSVLYGDKMPALLEELKRNKARFRSPPIGPIGLEISLNDNQWSLAVEAVIGRQLDCFVVVGKEDRNTLQSYLDSFGLTNSIYTVGGRAGSDRFPRPAHRSIVTVLDVMEIKNPIVTNLLVRISNINRIILVHDRKQGYRLLQECSSGDLPVDCAFTSEGHKLLANSSNSSRSVLSFYSGKRRLGVSVHDQLTQFKGTLKEKELHVAQMKQDVSKFEHDLRIKRDTIEAMQSRMAKNEELVMQFTRTLRNLKLSLEESQFTQPTMTQPRGTGPLDELRQKISLSNEQLHSAQEHLDQLMEEQNSAQQSLDTLIQQRSSFDQQLDDSRKLVIQLVEQKTRLTQQIDKYKALLVQEEAKILALQSEYDLLKQDSEHKEQVAMEITPDAPATPHRPSSQVEAELAKVEGTIEAREQDIGDPEVLLDQYTHKSGSLHSLQSCIRENEMIASALKTALDYRMLRWEHFRNGIANRANVHFIWNLMNRGFTGSLDFDHSNQRLITQIVTNASSSNSNGNVTSLSGGERSFGTVSLLLALWENVHCPIRCLDEFDVFMDSVNRSQVIQMIVEFAKQHSTQYLFISPLGFAATSLLPPTGNGQSDGASCGITSEGTINDWVKVIKLKEPVRNQTILPYEQSN